MGYMGILLDYQHIPEAIFYLLKLLKGDYILKTPGVYGAELPPTLEVWESKVSYKASTWL